MTTDQMKEITTISKQFTKGLGIPINGSGMWVVDPLSGYLNSIGFENTLKQIPETEKNPLVLIMTFSDGSQLIPAAKDLSHIIPEAKNWTWV